MHARLVGLGGLLLAFCALLAVTFSTDGSLDYDDQVAPAMNALLAGDVGEFFRVQPVYGAFGVLVRLPFAALARLFDGGELLVYQLGALPCLMALGLVGFFLQKLMRERGQPLPAQLLVGVLLLVNPVTTAAVQRGHPEELLTAALVLGATLMAIRSRPGWAGVLLGLALGTKQWAVVAAIPVLIACEPGRRLRAALVAAVLAAALIAPMALVDSERFVTNNKMAQGGWTHASRLSVWWPIGSPREVRSGGSEGGSFTLRELPLRWSTLARPLIVVVAIALSLAFWLRRRRFVPEDTLGLLALILLLRCLLDPLNNDYYHAPFVLCLAAWEGLRVRGLPVLTLLAMVGLWGTLSSPWLSPQALGEQFHVVNNIFYLAWASLLAGWLVVALFGRRTANEAAAGLASRQSRSGLTRSWIREPQSSAP